MSELVDLEHARRMVPLLERGQEALRLRHATSAGRARPIAGAISVVTESDYAAHPITCLRHALVNGPLHILCDSGELVAQLVKVRQKW